MKRDNPVINTVILFSSLIMCFITGEVFIRFLNVSDSVDYKNLERILLFSAPAWKVDSNGAVRYLENEDIRTVTIYNDSIEYDIEFHTNNMGFIDHRDYIIDNSGGGNKRHYAFVGNSFTAGYHGGSPWVPELREKIWRSGNFSEIYNLGIGGTGFGNFYLLLKSMKEQIKFTDIVILAITRDFKRRMWIPLTDKNDIRFCSPADNHMKCLKRGRIIARIFDINSSVDEIFSIVNNVKKKASAEEVSLSGNIKGFLKRSRLIVFTYRRLMSFFAGADAEKIYDKSYEQTFMYLKKIREVFPEKNIYFIHLPDKDEVANNNYLIRLDMKESLKGLGIEYFPALTKCTFSKNMFFRNDAHPNSAGYRRISECVSNYLFQ